MESKATPPPKQRAASRDFKALDLRVLGMSQDPFFFYRSFSEIIYLHHRIIHCHLQNTPPSLQKPGLCINSLLQRRHHPPCPRCNSVGLLNVPYSTFAGASVARLARSVLSSLRDKNLYILQASMLCLPMIVNPCVGTRDGPLDLFWAN